MYATSGGVIALPGVRAYDTLDTTFTWRSAGPGSVIDLSGLEYLEGTTAGHYDNNYYYVSSIRAEGGGQIDLRSLATISDPNTGDTRQRCGA